MHSGAERGSLPATETSPFAAMPPSRGELAHFCALVLDDTELLHQLLPIKELGPFVAQVLETGRGRGFAFTAEDVQAAMRDRSLDAFGLGRLAETKLPPAGWLPIQTSWQDGRLYLHWAYFGAERLREPFYRGSVMVTLSAPFNRLFRHCTPIEGLAQWLEAHPPLRPEGFIFHLSRCGSTLVSQMLAALDQNVVVSEAGPIDAVVQAALLRPDLSEDAHALLLKWIVGALGQPRHGDERHLFVKLDCWHTVALPLFRRAFPDVPWTFLYRDPVEILVSQLEMPGAQMIPGMVPLPLADIERSLYPMKPEEYYAHVLARICEPVAAHGSAGLLVNYRDLPSAVWTAIMPHFGMACSESDRAVMAQAARYDAKAPGFEFAADSEAKQKAATAATRAAVAQCLSGVYARLEAMRSR